MSMAKHDLSPELRAHLLERMQHRAGRLVTVAAMPSAPDTVIALMAKHVTETAILLCGPDFAQWVLEMVFDATAETHGICRFCHVRPLRDDKTMCQVCWDTAASDDEITD